MFEAERMQVLGVYEALVSLLLVFSKAYPQSSYSQSLIITVRADCT